MEALKNILGNTVSAFNYKDWYARVVKVLSDNKYSQADIQKVVDSLA